MLLRGHEVCGSLVNGIRKLALVKDPTLAH